MEELLDCMICFERFVEPRILNCGHTYCCKCLDEYHRTNKNTRSDSDTESIPCPTCRESIPWPENGAKDLRLDFKTTKIQEFMNSFQKSSAPSPHSSPKLQNIESCAFCLASKKNTPSSVYCITCEKSYCKDCQIKHRENPVFGKHSTINIRKGNNGVNKINGLLSNNCEVHHNEILKYVCITCNQAVCTLCLIDKHQKDEVKPIDEFLNKTSSIIKNLLTEAGSRKYDFKKQLEEIESEKAASVKACAEVEKMIKKRSELLVDEIKKQETDLLSQVQKNHLSPIEKEMERIHFHLSKVKYIEQMANDQTMTLNKCLMIYPILIQRMHTIIDVDFKKDNNLAFSSLKFNPGTNLPNIGKIEIENKKLKSCFKKQSETESFDHPLTKQTNLNVMSKNFQVSARRTNEKNLSTDVKDLRNKLRQSCGIISFSESEKYEISKRKFSTVGFSSTTLIHKIYRNGNKPGEINKAIWIAELGKNMFVVSDSGNKRIQIFQTSGKVISVIDKDLNPFGISVTEKRNILVIDSVQKLIQVFSPDGHLISKWGSKKFSSPCDLAVCPDGDIIVSDLENSTVSLYQPDAKKILSLGLNGSEKNCFKEPRFVASGPNNEIIVSDCKDHKVKIFDKKGNLLAAMGSEGSKDGELSSPHGVCYTIEDQVLVADTGNNRISRYSKDGSFLEILSIEVSSPRAVIQVGKNTLVVSEYDSRNRQSAIKLFSIS